MLKVRGGYVGVDQEKTTEINKKRLTNKTNAVAYRVETGYIDALKILRARKVEGGQPRNPRQANLIRSENISMYTAYMYTEFDTSKETCMEAIKQGNYVHNQCLLNTLADC